MSLKTAAVLLPSGAGSPLACHPTPNARPETWQTASSVLLFLLSLHTPPQQGGMLLTTGDIS